VRRALLAGHCLEVLLAWCEFALFVCTGVLQKPECCCCLDSPKNAVFIWKERRTKANDNNFLKKKNSLTIGGVMAVSTELGN
jgi:hypothetical protein